MPRLARLLRIFFLAVAIGDLSAGASQAQSAPFTNSLGMRFVRVPGTNILMCTTDTTVSEYLVAGFRYLEPKFPQASTHPAVNVSWDDAQRFCAELSKKEGRKYRLPTNAEWNAAVAKTRYPWGNHWPPPNYCGNYSGQELRRLSPVTANEILTGGKGSIGGFTDRHPFTSPVGHYPANGLGLYDMGGNVWQWCEDYYRSSMNTADVLQKFPELRYEKALDGTPYRAVCGASWYANAEMYLRSSFRHRARPSSRYANLGFRCVVERSGR